MIVQYEVGDNIEFEDNIEVPFDLGAEFGTITQHVSAGLWKVEASTGEHEGSIFIVNEKWFIP